MDTAVPVGGGFSFRKTTGAIKKRVRTYQVRVYFAIFLFLFFSNSSRGLIGLFVGPGLGPVALIGLQGQGFWVYLRSCRVSADCGDKQPFFSDYMDKQTNFCRLVLRASPTTTPGVAARGLYYRGP